MKAKLLIFSVIGVIVVVIALSASANLWKSKFEIKYNNGTSDYYEYEITNKTNEVYRNVEIVFKCESEILSIKWEKSQEVCEVIQPGETKVVKVYWNYLDDNNEMTKFDIKRIKYNK